MKIAFVLFNLGDSGTHRSALNLAKGSRDKGFEVDLLVIHGDGVYKNFVPKGVNLIDLQLANAKPKCIKCIKCIKCMIKQLPDLVFGGNSGWKNKAFNKTYQNLDKAIKDKIHFLGYLPHEELPLLYGGADVFAFPSFWEGFGLPPLEAMACGTPVVTSNVSSLPEVVGDAAILVDPNSAEEIADAIYQILIDEHLALRLKSAGLTQAAKFTWSNTALQTYQVYESAVKGSYVWFN